MQALNNDMATQMLISKVKASMGGASVQEIVREVCERLEEKDERVAKMAKYYREEEEMLIREAVSRK